MATSDNPFVVPNVVTSADEPEDHQHDVPIVNIEEKDRETLEYEPPEVVAEEEKGQSWNSTKPTRSSANVVGSRTVTTDIERD
jgi:hypothetical protein